MGMKAGLICRSDIQSAPGSDDLFATGRKPVVRWKGVGAENYSIHGACSTGLRRNSLTQSSMPATVSSGNAGLERR
jgi:hypothetical protein